MRWRYFLLGMIAAPSVADADEIQDAASRDAEIRIGNIMPYTGLLAAFATIGKAEAAYFDMVNDNGGINGRKVRFISYDDSSDPATAMELTRQTGRDRQGSLDVRFIRYTEQSGDEVVSE